MVDAIVSVFLEKLLNVLDEETQFLSSGKEFEKLKDELLLMESFLKDADRCKRKNSTLQTIMKHLRKLVYEAEDILMDSLILQDHQNGASKFSICLRPAKLPSHYRVGKRLAEINEEMRDIKQNISVFLGVPLLDHTHSMEAHERLMARRISPVYDHTQVFGLEEDIEKIKNWLFEASDGILKIGIVGMGGLGKTTLAHEVFRDKGVGDCFERRIWVSVSQTFTEEQIMRSILRSLGDAGLGDDQNELLKKIKQYLLGKRYLIILDDVWDSEDHSWWDKICVGLPQGNGSCVVITTRSVNVAQKMRVSEERTHWHKCLDDKYSSLLFCHIAFAETQGECSYPELDDVGKEIVNKCKGLPLAIKAIAGVLLFKPTHYHEWKQIADHFHEELAENTNSVKASLQLSYDELPPYLKSCFLSLSVFPEDCEIDKEQLIHWWIGESFIPLRNHRLSTEIGEDCFSELINRCLIEMVDKDYKGTIQTCKIHDMVRDMVIRIAKDNAFMMPNDTNSHHSGINSDMSPDQLVDNGRLRALLTTTKSGEVNKISSNLTKAFCGCQHLQVLDLSKSTFESSITSLLVKIGSLQHLTYLNFSNTHPLVELPSSLSKLQKLQILNLSYCQCLKILPPCIASFQNLKVLNVNNCGSLEYLPNGLKGLLNLEVLIGFKPAKSDQLGGCRIAELRSLKRLRKLSLRLSHGDEIGSDESNALVHLELLQFLTINCFECHDENLAKKIDKLHPPRQLLELSLKFFPEKVSPGWLSPRTLPMLRYLSIIAGNLTRINDEFWSQGTTIWRIEALQLQLLSDLILEWSMVHQAMPLLRILNVSWCPELVSFPVEDAGFKGGVWKKERQRT